MFTTQHKKSPKRIATLPAPSQDVTPPLSPLDCVDCGTIPCTEECECEECLLEFGPGFAPGETIELDEIALTLLSIAEVRIACEFIEEKVDEWHRQMLGLLKAPRGHHVKIFRQLSDGEPPYLRK